MSNNLFINACLKMENYTNDEIREMYFSSHSYCEPEKTPPILFSISSYNDSHIVNFFRHNLRYFYIMENLIDKFNNRPFFAREVNLNGGVIRALSYYNIIEFVGEKEYSKVYTSEDGDSITITNSVCEWKINIDKFYLERIANTIACDNEYHIRAMTYGWKD